jgi:hypothetical protein
MAIRSPFDEMFERIAQAAADTQMWFGVGPDLQRPIAYRIAYALQGTVWLAFWFWAAVTALLLPALIAFKLWLWAVA